MGANEKLQAAMHEYVPSTESVREEYRNGRQFGELYSKTDFRAEFDRWLETVRAEAKAESLNEAAAEIDRLESIGDTARNQVSEDQEKDYWRFHGTPITDWLRDRAELIRAHP